MAPWDNRNEPLESDPSRNRIYSLVLEIDSALQACQVPEITPATLEQLRPTERRQLEDVRRFLIWLYGQGSSNARLIKSAGAGLSTDIIVIGSFTHHATRGRRSTIRRFEFARKSDS